MHLLYRELVKLELVSRLDNTVSASSLFEVFSLCFASELVTSCPRLHWYDI